MDNRRFLDVYAEWKKGRQEVQYVLSHIDPLACAACYQGPGILCQDGNRKLYTWDRKHDNSFDYYYEGLGKLFIEDEVVDSQMKVLDEVGSRAQVRVPDTVCGDTERRWKAAKDSKLGIKHQKVTWVVMAGCRHEMVQGAVNMVKTGERYGYAYILCKHLQQTRDIQFLLQDIPCKFQPWVERVERGLFNAGYELTPTTLTAALNKMHGELHSWACQVLWSVVNKKGAGNTHGESMERIFTVFSRFENVTKTMGDNGTVLSKPYSNVCQYGKTKKQVIILFVYLGLYHRLYSSKQSARTSIPPLKPIFVLVQYPIPAI